MHLLSLYPPDQVISVLDPSKKLAYFKKNWVGLEEEVLKTVQEQVAC